jgi:hypothetical protein
MLCTVTPLKTLIKCSQLLKAFVQNKKAHLIMNPLGKDREEMEFWKKLEKHKSNINVKKNDIIRHLDKIKKLLKGSSSFDEGRSS